MDSRNPAWGPTDTLRITNESKMWTLWGDGPGCRAAVLSIVEKIE